MSSRGVIGKIASLVFSMTGFFNDLVFSCPTNLTEFLEEVTKNVAMECSGYG